MVSRLNIRPEFQQHAHTVFIPLRTRVMQRRIPIVVHTAHGRSIRQQRTQHFRVSRARRVVHRTPTVEAASFDVCSVADETLHEAYPTEAGCDVQWAEPVVEHGLDGEASEDHARDDVVGVDVEGSEECCDVAVGIRHDEDVA